MSKKKAAITVIACVIALWVIAGSIDFALVHNFRRPLFCVCSAPMQDGGSGSYTGLGYSFYIEGNFVTEDGYCGVSLYKGYLLGQEVISGSRLSALP